MLGEALIIMLVGMGITFTFLLLLWGVIRLVGLLDRRPSPSAAAASPPPPPGPPPPAVEDDGRPLAAALAVALALGSDPARAADPAQATASAPGTVWRQAGRGALMAGPEIVAAARAGRGGRS